MRELSKVFDGVELPVQEINQELYFDISGVANKYGKQLSHWENLESTKEYFEALEIVSVQENIKLIIKQGQSAYLHREIFVLFARWINVKFAVWADRLVIDILTRQTQVIETQLKAKDKKIELLSSSLYAKPRGGNLETVTRIIKDYSVQITPHKLNELLAELNVLGKEEMTLTHYTAHNMSKGVPLVHTRTVLEILDTYAIKRGQGYEDKRPTLF